jgi:probable HAF family extracellular repeat protein
MEDTFMKKYRSIYRTIVLSALVISPISPSAFATPNEGSLVFWGDNGYPGHGLANVPAGNIFVAIAGGEHHSLALKSDGSLTAWGSNFYGATNVPAGNDFVAVAAGAYYGVALKSDGSLAAWGWNYNGQTDVPAGNDFVAIVSGVSHGLALRSNGSLAGWGYNYDGQTNVPAGNDFVAIAAGQAHSLALKSDGSLAAWGRMTDIPAGDDFVAIAAGGNHSLALKSDGSLVGWGDTYYGQLNVPAGNDFVAIAAGHLHSVALKSDGSLAAWGNNDFGQTNVPAGNNFVAIAAGSNHGLAIRQVPEPSTFALAALGAVTLAMRRIRRTTNLLCLFSALSVTAAAHAASYTVTDLGTLGGTESFGSGLNASGQVAGAAYTTGSAAYHTFLWKPNTPNGASGTKIDLGTLGGTESFGNGLNASVQVTGESFTTGDAAERAFLWKPTTPGGASGTMYNLGTLGGTNSYGYGINAAGQVTGASDTTGDSATHAFLWKPTTPNGTSGTMHDLGSLGGTDSNGSAINAGGQVAGFSYTTGHADSHAFLWTPTTPNGTSGMMLDLGTLGGLNSYSYNVGAGGQVVGASEIVTTSDRTYAFLYTSGSGIVDLNTLIDPVSGWELLDASDINDAGQITGQGLISGQYHAYLLTPVLLGDFNFDGNVDAADYVMWRKTDGTPAGYNVWRTHFGTGGGSSAVASANAAVPEPATLAMLILVMAGECLRRHHAAHGISNLVNP